MFCRYDSDDFFSAIYILTKITIVNFVCKYVTHFVSQCHINVIFKLTFILQIESMSIPSIPKPIHYHVHLNEERSGIIQFVLSRHFHAHENLWVNVHN